jgi:hypothetical protein
VKRGLAVAVVLLAGCGGGGTHWAPDSSQQQQNVMVIDEDIDLSVSELAGKVSGAYTETCRPDSDGSDDFTADGGASDGGAAFASMKQAAIAAYSQVDDSCHLQAGISGKAAPLQAITQYRDRWNAMIRANQTPGDVFSQTEWDQINGPIQNELATFPYHGTSTSTTVAHAYPDVRLVLVERALVSEQQAAASFTCFVQSEIDQTVAVLTDPDVFAAAVHQTSTLDTDFAAAMSAHHVGIVNESFGSASRASLESMQATMCPDRVDLSAFFAALTAIDVAHAATLTGPAVLTVRAAGNDGVTINTGADALDCNPGDPTGLLAGSYNPGTGQQNSFSNSGACVDLYAPGQAIVTTYAGDWLLPVSGTSFSAPLTARFASVNAPSPFQVGTTRQAVLSNLDSTQELPSNLFPSDFFYTPWQVTTAALVAAAPAQRPPPRRLRTADFRRVMAPLRLLRRLQKS